MNLADLKKPFPPDRISWRVGSTTKDKTKGMALAYIDARDVQDRLDDVCGVENWQNRYPHANGKTVCEVGIYVRKCLGVDNDHGEACYEWVWKADGAGDSDIEAEKGALSDAFKRSAVKWGIGRYLYDLDSPWVELDTYEKNGQTFVKGIKQSEYAKLRKLLEGTAPKKDPYQDEDGQLSNWLDMQREIIKGCSTVADVEAWKESVEEGLKRLRKSNLKEWNALRVQKEAKIFEINTKGLAA